MCIFAGYAWDCCFVLECLHWTLQPGPSELDIVSQSDPVLLGCLVFNRCILSHVTWPFNSV